MKRLTYFVFTITLCTPTFADSMYDNTDSSIAPHSNLRQEEGEDILQADEVNEPAEYSDWSQDQLLQNGERQDQQTEEDEMYEDFRPQDEVDSYNEDPESFDE